MTHTEPQEQLATLLDELEQEKDIFFKKNEIQDSIRELIKDRDTAFALFGLVTDPAHASMSVMFAHDIYMSLLPQCNNIAELMALMEFRNLVKVHESFFFQEEIHKIEARYALEHTWYPTYQQRFLQEQDHPADCLKLILQHCDARKIPIPAGRVTLQQEENLQDQAPYNVFYYGVIFDLVMKQTGEYDYDIIQWIQLHTDVCSYHRTTISLDGIDVDYPEVMLHAAIAYHFSSMKERQVRCNDLVIDFIAKVCKKGIASSFPSERAMINYLFSQELSFKGWCHLVPAMNASSTLRYACMKMLPQVLKRSQVIESLNSTRGAEFLQSSFVDKKPNADVMNDFIGRVTDYVSNSTLLVFFALRTLFRSQERGWVLNQCQKVPFTQHNADHLYFLLGKKEYEKLNIQIKEEET